MLSTSSPSSPSRGQRPSASSHSAPAPSPPVTVLHGMDSQSTPSLYEPVRIKYLLDNTRFMAYVRALQAQGISWSLLASEELYRQLVMAPSRNSSSHPLDPNQSGTEVSLLRYPPRLAKQAQDAATMLAAAFLERVLLHAYDRNNEGPDTPSPVAEAVDWKRRAQSSRRRPLMEDKSFPGVGATLEGEDGQQLLRHSVTFKVKNHAGQAVRDDESDFEVEQSIDVDDGLELIATALEIGLPYKPITVFRLDEKKSVGTSYQSRRLKTPSIANNPELLKVRGFVQSCRPGPNGHDYRTSGALIKYNASVTAPLASDRKGVLDKVELVARLAAVAERKEGEVTETIFLMFEGRTSGFFAGATDKTLLAIKPVQQATQSRLKDRSLAAGA